jgi:general secretion pathway protein H
VKATRRSRCHDSHRGFTLLEILIVLFIISIMTGLTLVNLPQFAQTSDFDSEVDRLKVVIEMLRDESLVQANEYGFRPDKNHYYFYIYNEVKQSWELLDEKPFASRELPDNIRLSLRVEGGDFEDDEQEAPPVLILSSGEITPFELEIKSYSDRNLVRTLESDGYGDISWQEQGQDEDR